MVGIIWFVQLNHYPMFHLVKDNFQAFEADHVRRTFYVIMPLMLLEMITAVMMIFYKPTPGWWINIGILALIWLSTFFIQVPLHNQLSGKYNAEVIDRLVSTNWIRTALWTIKGLLVVYLIK